MDVTVPVYHDMESGCGQYRPVPAGDKEPCRVDTDGQAPDPMDVEGASVNVHPRSNGARAPLRNLSTASADSRKARSVAVPADIAEVPADPDGRMEAPASLNRLPQPLSSTSVRFACSSTVGAAFLARATTL